MYDLQKFIDGVLHVPDDCIDTRKSKDGTIERTLNVPQHVFDIECEVMFYLQDNCSKYIDGSTFAAECFF